MSGNRTATVWWANEPCSAPLTEAGTGSLGLYLCSIMVLFSDKLTRLGNSQKAFITISAELLMNYSRKKRDSDSVCFKKISRFYLAASRAEFKSPIDKGKQILDRMASPHLPGSLDKTTVSPDAISDR